MAFSITAITDHSVKLKPRSALRSSLVPVSRCIRTLVNGLSSGGMLRSQRMSTKITSSACVTSTGKTPTHIESVFSGFHRLPLPTLLCLGIGLTLPLLVIWILHPTTPLLSGLMWHGLVMTSLLLPHVEAWLQKASTN